MTLLMTRSHSKQEPTCSENDVSQSFLNFNDWDELFQQCLEFDCINEGKRRMDLVAEYLIELLNFVKSWNESLQHIHTKELELLLADEREERRFIEEDVAKMPHTLFTEYMKNEVVKLLCDIEYEERRKIIHEEIDSAFLLLEQEEEIHRKVICTEALDSIFMMHCQTSPGWLWKKLSLTQDNVDNVYLQKIIKLQENENDYRTQIINERKYYLQLQLEARAYVEKNNMFYMECIPAEFTATKLLNYSATKVGAVFRGYRTRTRQLYDMMRYRYSDFD